MDVLQKKLVGTIIVVAIIIFIIFTIFITAPAIKERGDPESYAMIMWGLMAAVFGGYAFTGIGYAIIDYVIN